MAAKTHLFNCLSDNFGVLIHDPQTGATASIDAPEAAAVEAALKATGWTTDRYPRHPSPQRPYRRHRRAEAKAQMPRGRPEQRQVQECRRNGRRRRQMKVGNLDGARARDARPYARPHLLHLRFREDRVRRRYAVLGRMRAGDRRHHAADVAFAAEAARAAGRHGVPLRPRIHAGQYQVRADHRAGQRRI